MKELQRVNKDQQEIKADVKQEKQVKHIATILPKRGHTLFQFNTVTKEITIAEYKEENIDFQRAALGNMATSRKVLMKKDCVYVSALNKNNALKKLGVIIK